MEADWLTRQPSGCSVTDAELAPWWEADLSGAWRVTAVQILSKNWQDGTYHIRGAAVQVDGKQCGVLGTSAADSTWHTIDCPGGGLVGAKIRIQAATEHSLTFCGIRVLGYDLDRYREWLDVWHAQEVLDAAEAFADAQAAIFVERAAELTDLAASHCEEEEKRIELGEQIAAFNLLIRENGAAYARDYVRKDNCWMKLGGRRWFCAAGWRTVGDISGDTWY